MCLYHSPFHRVSFTIFLLPTFLCEKYNSIKKITTPLNVNVDNQFFAKHNDIRELKSYTEAKREVENLLKI